MVTCRICDLKAVSKLGLSMHLKAKHGLTLLDIIEDKNNYSVSLNY
jgi:hypothetical protein